MSTPLDYDALRQALDKTLQDVDRWRVTADRIVIDENTEPLGHGGYSTVWAAHFTARSGYVQDVAVKVLRTGLRKKDILHVAIALARELRVWATLEHPNVLPLLGFRLDLGQDSAWIISPRMISGNARDFFAQIKPDFERRLQTAREMTEALLYLHESDPPVCHGDLKPDNLLINDGGHVLLSDFGLTVIPDTTSGLTTTRGLKGTVRYLAPELMEADEPVRTLKSDIWAYGCVVGELFTDELPYARFSSDFHVTREILKGTTPIDSGRLAPTRLINWTCSFAEAPRPHIRQCRDILSNPLPRFLLSSNSGYNSRDLETASYAGETISMHGELQWDGWAATSTHRSCRLYPVSIQGVEDLFNRCREVYISHDGLSFGFFLVLENRFEVVIYNTVTKARTSLQNEEDVYDPLQTACSGDLQFFCLTSHASFTSARRLRIWRIASRTCVLDAQFTLDTPPYHLYQPREGLCIVTSGAQVTSHPYGTGESSQPPAVIRGADICNAFSLSFSCSGSYCAATPPPERDGNGTRISFVDTGSLGRIGELKITGLSLKDFVLAEDGKSAILVEQYDHRKPRTLFHCDLSAVFPLRSSAGIVQCPIRCIASRLGGRSPANGDEAAYDPTIRISPDGTYAVVIEDDARTIVDLQTGLILREFWVNAESLHGERLPRVFDDPHLALDSLSRRNKIDSCFKYDVDPPCPLSAEECRYHDWKPIPWATAEFEHTEVAGDQ